MAITRYSYRNPWRELDQLTNRLSRVFDGSDFQTPNGGDWLPSVNVEETADDVVLTAELPGMKREDISIELENNVLTIGGERSEERTEGEEKRYHLIERRYGAFQRSFTLPRTVDPDGITADYEAGVLRISMPKAAEAKGRRIEIGSRSEAETR